MSKITICEGNIKWTSKGNTVLHAFDGDISFSAGECNIWSGEQGNETGEYIADADSSLGNNIILSGWWTDLNNNKITEANVLDTVRFHFRVHNDNGSIEKATLYLREQDPFSDDKLLINGWTKGEISLNNERMGYIDINLNWDLHKEFRTNVPLIKENAEAGTLELFMKATYKGKTAKINANGQILKVYKTAKRLFLKPASIASKSKLPEFYTLDELGIWQIVSFLLLEIPELNEDVLVGMKTKYKENYNFDAKTNTIKKIEIEEIYKKTESGEELFKRIIKDESDDLNAFFIVKPQGKNTKSTLSFDILELSYEKVSEDKKNPRNVKINKWLNTVKDGIQGFNNLLILETFRTSVLEFKENGKIPNLSTLLTFAPGGIPIAIALCEFFADNVIRELENDIDQVFWKDWQIAKAKGLEEAMRFTNDPRAKKKDLKYIKTTKEALDILLDDGFKTFSEFESKSHKVGRSTKPYIVFYYIKHDEYLNDYYYLIDSVFVKGD